MLIHHVHSSFLLLWLSIIYIIFPSVPDCHILCESVPTIQLCLLLMTLICDNEFLTDISVTLECFEWPVIAYQFTDLGWINHLNFFPVWGLLWRHLETYLLHTTLQAQWKKRKSTIWWSSCRTYPLRIFRWQSWKWFQRWSFSGLTSNAGYLLPQQKELHFSQCLSTPLYQLPPLIAVIWMCPPWRGSSLSSHCDLHFELKTASFTWHLAILWLICRIWLGACRLDQAWAKSTASPLPRWMTVSSISFWKPEKPGRPCSFLGLISPWPIIQVLIIFSLKLSPSCRLSSYCLLWVIG